MNARENPKPVVITSKKNSSGIRLYIKAQSALSPVNTFIQGIRPKRRKLDPIKSDDTLSHRLQGLRFNIRAFQFSNRLTLRTPIAKKRTTAAETAPIGHCPGPSPGRSLGSSSFLSYQIFDGIKSPFNIALRALRHKVILPTYHKGRLVMI